MTLVSDQAAAVSRWPVLFLALGLGAAVGACDRKPLSPQQIIDRMTNTYASCQSYQEVGECTRILDMPGVFRPQFRTTGSPTTQTTELTNRQSFSFEFRRPASVRFDFELAMPPTPAAAARDQKATNRPRPRLVLASDGQQTCLYSDTTNLYWRADSLSNGLAQTRMLYHAWGETVLDFLTDSSLGTMQVARQHVTSVRDDVFEGTPCDVLVSQWAEGMYSSELWIGKRDYLLRKKRTTIAGGEKRGPTTMEELHRSIQINRTIPESTFRIALPVNAHETTQPFSLLLDTDFAVGFRSRLNPNALKTVAFQDIYSGGGNAQHPKVPSYIECQPDRVVLYPGGTMLTLDDLQHPGNAVDQLLAKVLAHQENEYIVIMVRPGSLKYYRAIRNMIARTPVEVSYDAVDTNYKVTWDAANRAVAIAGVDDASPPVPPAQPSVVSTPSSPPIRIVSTNKRPVFFECRMNQLFFVDKDGLDAKVRKRLDALPPGLRGGDLAPFLKALQFEEIGNELYTVNPKFLMVGVMAIDARPDLRGDTMDSLANPTSAFQKELGGLRKESEYIIFLVRDDSFALFRRARMVTEQQGFDTSWELLGLEESIKFGQGGGAVTPQ